MGTYSRSYYHDEMPEWRSSFNKRGKYIGIEFELEARTNYRAVLRLLPDFSNRYRPITESDGSLSSERGLEIVFPPFLASTLKKKSSLFGQAIAAISGEVTVNNGAGMHMNINTAGWPRKKVNSLVALINNLPKTYLENIGQRGLTSYCSQLVCFEVDDYENKADHCFAAEDKGGCIEMRFPRSTSDHSRIVNLIEFFDFAEKFVDKIGVLPTESDGDYMYRELVRDCGCGSSDCYLYDDEPKCTMDYSGVNKKFDKFMLTGRRRRRIKEILDNGYTSG